MLFCTGSIVNVAAGETPPPGVGFATVTCAIPALATSSAVIDTASCNVSLLNTVGRADPFQKAVRNALRPGDFAVQKIRTCQKNRENPACRR